jgi:tRNA (cmo5U34)-methyltransferase
MGVAAHLGIELREYDHRIRTFIPYYGEMLDAAAAVVPRRARTIIDLGIGTGALAARCLAQALNASVVGIDADEAMLALAMRRVGPRATLVCGTFLRAPLPRTDAVVASFALHHVRTRAAKAHLFRSVRAALRPGGMFVSADCHPASDRAIAATQMRAWQAHVRASYPPARTRALLRSWAREDVYVPLEAELALFQRAGFRVDVVWRRDAFAVLAGKAALKRMTS